MSNTNGALGNILSQPMPSSGLNPLRVVLDPNDPAYKQKLGMIGALESQHELNTIPPQTPDYTKEIPTAPSGEAPTMPTKPTTPTPVAPEMTTQQPLYGVMPLAAQKPTDRQGITIESLAKPQRSVLGKIGHGLATAGNIAGDIFAPGTMALIPGTQLHGEIERAQQFRGERELTKEQQAQQALNQRPELAELKGIQEGALQAQKGAQKTGQISQTDADKAARQQSEDAVKQVLAMDKPTQDAYKNLLVGGQNGGPQINPLTGQPYTHVEALQAVSQAAVKPPTEKPVAGTLDGKPAYGLYDPQKGWLNAETKVPAPNFQPPPNWAQSMSPVTTIDPNTGLPVVSAFSRGSGTVSTPTSPAISGTGPYGHQIESAQALLRMVDTNINPLIDKMTKNDELGPIQGRFSDWLNRDIGNAPPDVAQLHQLMNGAISMMMGMYGFRRQQAVDALSAQMGARMTPESIRAALKGITAHANSIIGGAVKAPDATGGGFAAWKAKQGK